MKREEEVDMKSRARIEKKEKGTGREGEEERKERRKG